MTTRKPDGGMDVAQDNQEDQGLMACAEALIQAMHAKDAKAVVAALKDIMDVIEDSPEHGAEEAQENE